MSVKTKKKRELGGADLQDIRSTLQALSSIDTELKRRITVTDPLTYGMPDLLRPQTPEETPEQLAARQNAELKGFIETKLWAIKDTKKIFIKLAPPMLEFIADLFYKRTNQAILWKGRGSGGSLCTSILMWLAIVYHKMSFTSMAGCLLPGTPVWTKVRGWVPVEDVSEDDEVLDKDGVIRRVISKTAKEWDGPVTRITPLGYNGSTFTSDHRVWVLRGVVQEDKRGHLLKQDIPHWDELLPQWAPCGSITPQDVFVLPRPKHQDVSLPSLWISTGIGGKEERVQVPWTPDFCRFLGYWLAEGSTYQIKGGGRYVRFDVGEDDRWLDDLQDLIVRLFGRKPTYDEPNGDATLEARIRFGSNDVAQFLEDVFGKGATGKRIPWDLIVGLDDECVKALHVGYLRGDGSVVGTNRGGFDVSSYTVSPSLSAGIYWLSLRLGLFPAFGVVHPEEGHPGFQKVHDGWMTRYGSTDADSLIEAAFAWRSQKNRVPRQRRVWVSEDSVYVGVKEVQHSVYKGEVWDLEIEGDPSFALPMMVVHNSSEQAKNIYQYTKSFWNCVPELSRALLAEEPLQGETRLTNGVMLKIISASEKQARGKHNPGFVVDESCQEGENVDRMIGAAMQGAMSEPNYMVVVLSTFHHPIGLFQEIWDYAEERGFKRYFWNIYDAMETCKEGTETVTTEDPEALEFCHNQCPLTEKENTYDEEGRQIGWRYKGCNGKARCSKGFWLRKNVIMAKKMNRGTNVFEVEYENNRPNWMRPVYEPEWVEASLVDSDFPPQGARLLERSVGIDWGLEGQTVLCLCNYYELRNVLTLGDKEHFLKKNPATRFVVVTEAESMTGKLTGEAIKILTAWVEAYGSDKFKVYADVSHPFNNLEVEQVGFEVFRVPFNRWKDYGIGNIIKYFTTKGRFFIRSNLTGFIEQLKRYRQDKMGRPVKKDDHAPDSLLCGMLNYPFEERFKEDLDEIEIPKEEVKRGALPSFEGCSPVSSQVMVVGPPCVGIPTKKNFDGQSNVR